MSNLVVSVLVLAAYTLVCVGWWARHKQLDRRRAARNRVRRINAYSMHHTAVRKRLGAEVWPSNVVNLDTHSRKVDAA